MYDSGSVSQDNIQRRSTPNVVDDTGGLSLPSHPILITLGILERIWQRALKLPMKRENNPDCNAYYQLVSLFAVVTHNK